MPNAQIRAREGSSPLSIIEPDMAFHRALVDATGSDRLSAIYALLTDEVRLCMTRVQGAALLKTADISRQHEELLEQIGDGSPEGAVAVLHHHLDNAREQLREHRRAE